MDEARSGDAGTEAARLDALRRRLYAPAATPADVAAYRAAESARSPDEAGSSAAPTTAPGVRRTLPRGVRTAVAGGAVLLLLLGVLVITTAHPLAALTATGASPTPPATSPAAAEQESVPASSSDRQRFVRALQAGDSAGLLQYLYGHPDYLPAQLRTPLRADSTEYSGQGASTIALGPSDLAQHGGRVTVILVVDRSATFSWVAGRIAQQNDRSGPVVAVGSHAGSAREGEPVSATVAYTGGAPVRLDVYLDETVKWGAVVVFTD